MASHFSLRVGCARSFSPGEHERRDAALLIQLDGVIEAFPKYGRGFVMPGCSPEDDGTVSILSVVAKTVTADRNGLPGEIECECAEEAEDEAPEIARLPFRVSPIIRRGLRSGVGSAVRFLIRGADLTCCLTVAHTSRLYSTPVWRDGEESVANLPETVCHGAGDIG